MTDKSLIRNFVAEVKQQKYLKSLFKKNTIEMDNYFKYSGKTIDEIDPTVLEPEQVRDFRLAYEAKKIKGKNIHTIMNRTDSLIIDYFYRNPNKTMTNMSEDLNIPVHKIRKVMNKNLDRNSW
tara:strand:- start:609 stop:977 length:369 start_codon:yes stop_codon:yes gene_type:complete